MKENTNLTDRLILIGEDDVDDKEILEEIFMSIDTSLKLHFLNNGEKLIHFLKNSDELPCLIILDYNMPDLNGAQILKGLENIERLKKIPKMIWSTSDAPTFKQKCLELGACEYLVKPGKIKDLENMIRHMLSYCEV
jgi:CheY-like chemotaxis protein